MDMSNLKIKLFADGAEIENIVEFNNKGKLYPFPGFINNKDNEDQLCVPCCFSKLGDKYQDVKTKCLAKVNKLVVGKDERKVFDAEEEEYKNYNLNAIKNPARQG